jgi:hypothetical protein
MTVRQLLSGIDSLELSEWVAFFNLQNRGAEKKRSLEEQFKDALTQRRKGRKGS